jgi:hypothetical protein
MTDPKIVIKKTGITEQGSDDRDMVTGLKNRDVRRGQESEDRRPEGRGPEDGDWRIGIAEQASEDRDKMTGLENRTGGVDKNKKPVIREQGLEYMDQRTGIRGQDQRTGIREEGSWAGDQRTVSEAAFYFVRRSILWPNCRSSTAVTMEKLCHCRARDG